MKLTHDSGGKTIESESTYDSALSRTHVWPAHISTDRCPRCLPAMPSFTSLVLLARRAARQLLFDSCILRESLRSYVWLTTSHLPGACPDTVRQREPRQLTAAGQSQTLTPECQSETRSETGRQAAAAGQSDNLNSLLVAGTAPPSKSVW